MEFFTQLIIYYPLQGYDMVASIWFDTFAQCENVLRSGGLEVIYSDPKEVAILCQESDVMSSSIRPKARPEDG